MDSEVSLLWALRFIKCSEEKSEIRDDGSSPQG